MSTIRQSSILDQANTAAHHITLPWIRSVFRELCYQVWKDHWKVDHVVTEEGDSGSNTHCRLHMTVEMIAQAQAICQRVAAKWSQRVQATGHVEVARWILGVCQREMSTFFAEDDEEDVEDLALLSPVAAHTQEDAEEDEEEDEVDQELLQARKESLKHLGTLTTLRALELPLGEALTQAQQEQYVIDQLDEMGHSGKTDWPYDWEEIQEATRRMQEKAKKMYGHVSSEHGEVLKLKLVPKSSVQQPVKEKEDGDNNTPQQETNGDNGQDPQPYRYPNKDDGSKWTELMVAKYKQRGHFLKRKAQEKLIAKASKKKKTKTGPVVPPMDPPRPPNAMDETGIPWNHQVREELVDPALDACLHPPEDDESSSADAIPHTLLGAIKTLGHVHHFHQFPLDHVDQVHTMTDRAQKVKFTRSAVERTGVHQMEKVVTANKVRSKIKTTLKANGQASDLERWWDLDLGECLLDLQEEEDGDGRKLYAFASLEIALRDEDERTCSREFNGEQLRFGDRDQDVPAEHEQVEIVEESRSPGLMSMQQQGHRMVEDTTANTMPVLQQVQNSRGTPGVGTEGDKQNENGEGLEMISLPVEQEQNKSMEESKPTGSMLPQQCRCMIGDTTSNTMPALEQFQDMREAARTETEGGDKQNKNDEELNMVAI